MARYEYEYYSLSLNNIDEETKGDGTVHEPHLKFEEQRDGPIIENCEDYDFSIENFKIDLKTLPVFIPTIRSNFTGNPEALTSEIMNTTIYSLSVVGYQSVENPDPYISGLDQELVFAGSAPVIFTPQDETKTQPIFRNGYAVYDTGYYNIYNYEFFVVLLNRAIATATNNLIDTYASPDAVQQTGSANASWINQDLPYFIFDKDTQLISLQSPAKNYVTASTQTAGMKLDLILNIPLYRLFNSLPFTLQSRKVFTLSRAGALEQKILGGYKMNLDNFGAATISMGYMPQLDGSVSKTEVEYSTIYQDYSTMDSWSPVESIVMCSDSIPVKPSARSATHRYVNGNETTIGSLSVIELEVTDFKAGNYEGGVIYNPLEKRWLNMVQQSALTKISLSVFYRSKLTGALIPIRLNSGGSFSMKMVFRKLMY